MDNPPATAAGTPRGPSAAPGALAGLGVLVAWMVAWPRRSQAPSRCSTVAELWWL